jgi:hypothetical protein
MKKSIIVKPAISWLTTDSDPLLINDTNVILTAMAANSVIYPTPSPTLTVIQAVLTTFNAAVAKAAVGTQADTSAKNNQRLVLVGMMRQLASYVQTASKGDMTNLLLSGFPTQKPERQPIGPLPAPANLTVAAGMHSGQIEVQANPVFGAASYTWRAMPATTGASAVTLQTTAANATLTGLTPGVNYTITVNAIGAAGASEWSNPASLFCN